MDTATQSKGELTRRHILESALRLFRRRGFERTTMRDIAQACGLALGAAYHYFPSKEALVQAYYEWMQGEHERLAAAAAAPEAELGARLRTLLETKLALLRKDRRILAALFANLGDPSHSLSLFGEQTAAVRERSIAQFVALFERPSVPVELRELLGRALWLAHLGIFLFFVHDKSPNQARTQALVDALIDFVSSGVPLLTHPLAAPVRARLLQLMQALDPARGARS